MLRSSVLDESYLCDENVVVNVTEDVGRRPVNTCTVTPLIIATLVLLTYCHSFAHQGFLDDLSCFEC